MKRGKPVHGLEKIPDNELIKELRIELGKANAYIQELEHDAKKANEALESKSTELKNIKKKNHRNNRIRYGRAVDFEQWCVDNSIPPEQKQKLIVIIEYS